MAALTCPLLALVLVVLSVAQAAAVQQALSSDGPLCTGNGSMAHLSSTAVGQLLGDMGAPPAGALCSWLVPGAFCNRIAALQWASSALGKLTDRCNALRQVPPLGAPTPFQDLRPLPPDISNATELLREEGSTYSWLYANILNLERYSPCAPDGNGTLLVPEGWQLHSTLNTTEGDDLPPLPLVVVLVQPEARQLLILARGTMTAHEWTLDFSWNHTSLPSAGLHDPVHWGFVQLFEEVWSGVEEALGLVVDGGIDEVYLAGHSLGGGVGTLLAYAAQSHLGQQLGDAAPVISTALFAPPNAGSPEFVASYNERVNGRRIAYQDDLVPQGPCTPRFPSCTAADLEPPFTLLSGALIATNMPGNVSEWSFGQVGGSLVFSAGDMPEDAASWAAVSTLQLCWTTQFLAATHICSYACFTSQFLPGGSRAGSDTGCWLSERPPGAAGTSCRGWPPSPLYPGMGEEAAP